MTEHQSGPVGLEVVQARISDRMSYHTPTPIPASVSRVPVAPQLLSYRPLALSSQATRSFPR